MRSSITPILLISTLTVAALALAACAPTRPVAAPSAHGTLAAKVVPVVDDYYGTKITDPYRWMESGKDADWLPWLKAQAGHTRSVFDAMPGRAALLADISARSGDLAQVRGAEQAGGRLFYERRDAGAQDSRLLLREVDGRERVLLDPTQVKGDGEQVMDGWSAAPDGRHVVVALSRRGTEHSALRVIDVESGRLLDDAIAHAWMGSWTPDGLGFSYLKLVGEPGTPAYYVGNEPRLHRIGATGVDTVLARRGENGIVASPQQFLLVAFMSGSDTALAFVRDGRPEVALYRADADAAQEGRARWTPIATFDDVVTNAELHGDKLYLLSEKNASGGKLLLTSAKQPDLAAAKAIPLPGDPVIAGIVAIRAGLLVRTVEGAASGLWRVSAEGTPHRIALPFDASIAWIDGSPESANALVALTGWFTPSTVHRLDLEHGRFADDLALAPPPSFDTSAYEAARFEAPARDGVKIPYTIIRRAGVVADADTPVLLDAYGAYGFAYLPRFRAELLPFLDRGGIYVFANVRGGGEFGRDWHYAGKAETKANTWRDAIAVAEKLVADHVGSSKTLTLIGTSAGGVMVGGAINERPDLFSGAIANVGFMNPIRYVAEQNYADIEEWGGPIKDAQSFKTMLDLDPYQHIRSDANYPATLVISGLNDPRAATFHSAKYAARLAAATASGKPVLLRIDFDAGHGFNSSRSQMDEASADIGSFVFWRAGRPDFQPR